MDCGLYNLGLHWYKKKTAFHYLTKLLYYISVVSDWFVHVGRWLNVDSSSVAALSALITLNEMEGDGCIEVTALEMEENSLHQDADWLGRRRLMADTITL